jgi:hypothetical protein
MLDLVANALQMSPKRKIGAQLLVTLAGDRFVSPRRRIATRGYPRGGRIGYFKKGRRWSPRDLP